MEEENRRRFNILEARIERLEKLVGPVNYPPDTINSGDWTSLEHVEVGDIVGRIELKYPEQVQILRAAHYDLKEVDKRFN